MTAHTTCETTVFSQQLMIHSPNTELSSPSPVVHIRATDSSERFQALQSQGAGNQTTRTSGLLGFPVLKEMEVCQQSS